MSKKGSRKEIPIPQLPKATAKQMKFAQAYLKTGNATQAALEAYDTKDVDSAAVVGSTNLRKLKVQELLQSFALDAANKMKKLSDQDKSLSVSYNATRDILDRTGHRASGEEGDDKQIFNILNVNVQDINKDSAYEFFKNRF